MAVVTVGLVGTACVRKGGTVAFSSTTTVTATPSSTSAGGSVTLDATVSDAFGAVGGTVTFTDTTVGQTLGTATLSGGEAKVTTSALTQFGPHTIQAVYGGAPGVATSSGTATVTVEGAP